MVVCGASASGKSTLIDALQRGAAELPSDAYERGAHPGASAPLQLHPSYLTLAEEDIGGAGGGAGGGGGGAPAVLATWDLSAAATSVAAAQLHAVSDGLYVLAVPAHEAREANRRVVLTR